MIELRSTDSKLVGHARRELEIAKLFDKKPEEDYDGFIGRGVLSLVKTFDDWAKDDQSRMMALHQVFNYLIQGDLLSPPTNDPNEWEDFEMDGQTIRRNKRNIFFITRDEGKTWFNIRTDQKGICNDFKTGEPVEGVEDPNGDKPETNDQESPANADNAGDGSDAKLAPKKRSKQTSTGKKRTPVEDGELDAGVEPKGKKDTGKAKAPKKKSQGGKA